VTYLNNFNILRLNLVTISSYTRNIKLASENIMLSVCVAVCHPFQLLKHRHIYKKFCISFIPFEKAEGCAAEVLEMIAAQ
jgi:hypothetical protein